MSEDRRATLATALDTLEACLRAMERRIFALGKLYAALAIVQAASLVLLLAIWWRG
jgi:hypothetical protein